MDFSKPPPIFKTSNPKTTRPKTPYLRIPEVAFNIDIPIIGFQCPNPSCRTLFDLNHPPLESCICPKCCNIRYCSVECMRGDQATHVSAVCQKLSVYKVLNNARQKANIVPGPLNTPINPSRKYALEIFISMPFSKLAENRWLHARSEHDVYKLLIDCYRWRVEEDQAVFKHFFSNLYDDPFHGGRQGFKQWLEFVEAHPTALPSWWTEESKLKVFAFAASSNDWSLDRVLTVEDMKGFYGPGNTMGIQMSVFSEMMIGIAGGETSTGQLFTFCLQKENDETLAYFKTAFEG